ncbi:MAG TPA: hypothetical protein VK912_01870 [Longimicrobiales bacterium]|nr:hypothetical protein [Longimicrobiales bacterium]
MHRELIHPNLPFTEQEHAAAWILLGRDAHEALAETAALTDDIRAQSKSRPDDKDTLAVADGPWFHFVGPFGAALHLAADIHTGGSLLDEHTRNGWLSQWTERVSGAEAEQRLAELARLGPTWAAHRDRFYQLLAHGSK